MPDLADELERAADRLDLETTAPLRELAAAVRANPRLAEVVEMCATMAWARRVLADVWVPPIATSPEESRG